ncbi:MAG: Polyribonucleotide nucleotidyltransferase [Dehalococcoidales bacterium]|nr:Polyribonucleotide nucleotidyltransferase [Dehalococcoidales bacterium]
MLKSQTFDCEVGGRKLTIETGKLAEQAAAAVTVRYGDTVVLVTACVGSSREAADFLPLTVDYEERLYAAGKIPGGFIRREGRPSQEATLVSRLTDRCLRPLLPKQWRREIQVIITVLSADQENDPDILAIIGSSAALSMSEIPFYGPVSAVRVGYINDELVLNPTLVQLSESRLDLVIASTKEAVVMIEAGVKEVSEEILTRALHFGFEANQAIIRLQEELQKARGKAKLDVPVSTHNPEVDSAVAAIVSSRLAAALSYANKAPRETALDGLKKEVIERLGQSVSHEELMAAFDGRVKAEIRASILERGKRVSGRGLREVRPISCEVGLLPRTHGSAIFTRGETQVLTITTLGSSRMHQVLDGLGIEETKHFMHHYNMPPFSNGEVKRTGNPGRREIGHGALVERSIAPVLPQDADFPYTIRLVSEVLSSSGSTSMASVCASSMSLMDAGIPIKRAVSGIAMGLVTGEDGRYVILTDIEGMEDNYGDMDFKVAGTTEGVTGLQMDIKLKGVSLELIEKTMSQAHEARFHILDIMNQTLSLTRPQLSRYAPRMYKISIDTAKIGAVIGPGGKTIRAIIEQTKASIDIDDSGTVVIGSSDEVSARRAIEIVQSLTRDVEVGSVYTGKVTRILPFGAMVEILPGKEGLVHISELADYRVASVEDIVKMGDEVMVKVIEVDNLGRVNLSRKAVLDKSSQEPGSQATDNFSGGRPPGGQQREARPRPPRPPFRPNR